MKNDKNIRLTRLYLLAFLISIFFTTFLWNFWHHGLDSLGINIVILWLAIVVLFLLTKKTIVTFKTLFWLLPFLAIVFSLGMYTTPFTGWISLFLLPIIFFIFTTHESHQNIRPILWSKFFPFTILLSLFWFIHSVIVALGKPLRNDSSQPTTPQKNNLSPDTTRQIIIGVIVLLLLSTGVVIPLLSSVDSSFANIFKDIMRWIGDIIINFKTLPWRITVTLISTVVLTGGVYYWRRVINSFFKTSAPGESGVSNNSITMGIILSGILVLYSLFIGIQIHTLFIGTLPFDFKEAESLVKSGFWQLFALTILNILLYIIIYKKTTKIVQGILALFTLTSLLLIVSAAHRVFLYVITYGLSFEKFFAFYTVIFCGFVFIWFLSLFARQQNKPAHIIRRLAFLALWMYAFTTIIPLERIILNTNLKLTQRTESKVDINELEMLGFDVLPIIEQNFDTFIKEARNDYSHSYNPKYYGLVKRQNFDKEEYIQQRVDKKWLVWLKENEDTPKNLRRQKHFDPEKMEFSNFLKKYKKEKKWYEKTISELLYSPQKVDSLIKILTEQKIAKVKTFKNDIHGFSLKYQRDILVPFYNEYYRGNDYKKLLKDDFTLTLTDKKTDDYLKIQSFDLKRSDPSDVNRYQRNKLKWIVDAKIPTTTLPGLPNEKVYAALIHGMCGEKTSGQYIQSYRFYIIHPERLWIICSNKKTGKETRYTDEFSSKKYINLIAPSKEFAEVIKSFTLIKQNTDY